MSNRELCHWPVQTGDPSYDLGRKTEEQTAPSAHRRGLLGSVSWTLLVHPCSFLSEKNRLVTNGVHLVREFIFSKRRQCKIIKTDPRFPCCHPFPFKKISFSLRFSPVPFGLPPPTLKTRTRHRKTARQGLFWGLLE